MCYSNCKKIDLIRLSGPVSRDLFDSDPSFDNLLGIEVLKSWEYSPEALEEARLALAKLRCSCRPYGDSMDIEKYRLEIYDVDEDGDAVGAIYEETAEDEDEALMKLVKEAAKHQFPIEYEGKKYILLDSAVRYSDYGEDVYRAHAVLVTDKPECGYLPYHDLYWYILDEYLEDPFADEDEACDWDTVDYIKENAGEIFEQIDLEGYCSINYC